MKPLAIALMVLGVTAVSLVASDARPPTGSGADDLSRYVATTTTPGSRTTLRDASGRTIGTATTTGTRTTFRDSSGRTTGVASVEGTRTVFRDASRRTIWTAASSGTQSTTYRDASGRTLSTEAKTGVSTTIRDASGRTTSTIHHPTNWNKCHGEGFQRTNRGHRRHHRCETELNISASPRRQGKLPGMERRTLNQLRHRLPPEHRHNVYVVLLDPAAGRLRKVRAENPKRDSKKPCVYVGMTGLAPEERFANHKAGIKAAAVVTRYGVRLLPELYAHLNPMPFQAATQMEMDLAEDLRRAGYTVTGGH